MKGTGDYWISTSFPGPFHWLGGGSAQSQGKGRGNEVDWIGAADQVITREGESKLKHRGWRLGFFHMQR